MLDVDDAQKRVAELAEQYAFRVDPAAVVEDLSVGEEQRVEILKALYRGVDILILDEPTAVLTPGETQDLFGNLRRLREAGRTIVFISHKLDEVLRDRRPHHRAAPRDAWWGRRRRPRPSKAKLAEMMVGRPVLFRLEKPQVEIGEPILAVEGLTGEGKLNGVDLQVRAGEILGVAGVEGNGQRELAEALIGLRKPASGRILLEGSDICGQQVSEIRNIGVGLHPGGPARTGPRALDDPVGEHAARPPGRARSSPSRLGLLLIRKIKELAARLVKLFDVRTRSVDVTASTLSGGNQQKLILARELETDPKLLVAAQPTRGPRRRGDRVRLEADPRAEGGGPGGPADLGRARRDLRAVGPDRHAVRGQDHRRVRAGRPARADRRRHARPDRGGGGVVATEGMAAPTARGARAPGVARGPSSASPSRCSPRSGSPSSPGRC